MRGFALKFSFFLIGALAATASSVAFAAPSLIQPLACQLGRDCWAVNYVDTNGAADAVADPVCGPRSYDGNEGTDFALRDLVAAREGVDVRAAAAGTVRSMKNDAEDRIPAAAEIEAMKAGKKSCGNGVMIDHEDGWQTIYCHLKKDSVTVMPGQAVAAGDRIGQAGYSGVAEFPHLHFSLFHDGKTVDPFTGAVVSPAGGAACEQPGASLWQDKASLHYEPVTLYDAGFSAAVPDFEKIKEDGSSPQTLAASSISALSFWGGLFGAQKGDRVRLEITDAQGRIFAARDIVQKQARPRQFYFVGKTASAGSPMMSGVYTGRISLWRAAVDGPPAAVIERTITVNP